MRRAGLIVFSLLLLVPLVVRGQALCDLLPCGPLPWSVPDLPVLESPTPMPTVNLTLAPTATSVPTSDVPTATVAPTSTVISSFDDLGDQLSTLQAQFDATSAPVEVSGTPIDPEEQLATYTGEAATFFGYVRGFSEVNLGGLTPFVTAALVTLATVIAIVAVTFLLPVLTAIFGVIFRIVQFVISLFKV